MATDSSPLYWPHDAPVICLDKNNINIQLVHSIISFFFKKKNIKHLIYVLQTKFSFAKLYLLKAIKEHHRKQTLSYCFIKGVADFNTVL